MFGYVKPMTAELKVRDNELYKAFYCGLCRAMGAHVCRTSRFTLSYDIVFLAIVRAAVSGESVTVKNKRCAVHPIKKRPVAYCERALPYSARASAILTYRKAADDVSDEKGFKRLIRRMALPFAARLRRKAALEELDAEIGAYLEKLSALEDGSHGPDECADEFGKTLAAVFSHAFGDETDGRILADLGYHVGRWIYLVDAADDLRDDRERGRFNPFAAYDPLPLEELENSLLLELNAAQNAYSLAAGKSPRLDAVIENILRLGMPQTQDKVLKKYTDKETATDDQGSL